MTEHLRSLGRSVVSVAEGLRSFGQSFLAMGAPPQEFHVAARSAYEALDEDLCRVGRDLARALSRFHEEAPRAFEDQNSVSALDEYRNDLHEGWRRDE